MQTMTGADNMMMQSPVDFTNSTRMLGASPALLQGKILRGGMGTDAHVEHIYGRANLGFDRISIFVQFEYHN
jgi:hypothetical protein